MLNTATKALTMILALAMLAITPNVASGKSQSTPKTCVWKKICPGPAHVGQVLPQVQNRIRLGASANAEPQQATHDGQWVTVEAITDLKEVATVYNVRVTEFHTYFVGSREWGFSVWAHNHDLCTGLVRNAIEHVTGRTTRLGEANLNRVAEAIAAGDFNAARQVLRENITGLTNQMATEITTNLMLSNAGKDALREAGRNAWQQATGRRAIWDNSRQVHHRIPLEYSDLFFDLNPNRVSNLRAVTQENHTLITNAWNAWRRNLGRQPTAAEVLRQADVLDQQFGLLMHLPL